MKIRADSRQDVRLDAAVVEAARVVDMLVAYEATRSHAAVAAHQMEAAAHATARHTECVLLAYTAHDGKWCA